MNAVMHDVVQDGPKIRWPQEGHTKDPTRKCNCRRRRCCCTCTCTCACTSACACTYVYTCTCTCTCACACSCILCISCVCMCVCMFVRSVCALVSSRRCFSLPEPGVVPTRMYLFLHFLLPAAPAACCLLCGRSGVKQALFQPA